VGFKDFVLKLQEMGLSRYIPKKSLPKKDFDPNVIVEKNPFSMEKWYYIGQ
jgi:nitrogen fixation protein